MSEKIFACLLRLYPSRFREKYTEEAVQLYRDLYRQETGLLERTRLWIRLLADLAAGLPQAYRNIYVSPAASPVAQGVEGMPTFRLLEQEPLRPGLFLFGSVLTLALLGAFSAALSHPALNRAWGVSMGSSSPIEAVLERLNRPENSGPSGNESPQADESVPDTGRNGEARKADSVAAQPAGVETQKAIPPTEMRPVIQPAVESPSVPQWATSTQQAMRQDEKHGAYDTTAGGTASIARRTPDLQRTTPDTQKAIAYNNNPTASRIGPSAAAISPYRAAAKQQNCAFEKIEVLPHNIGYFKLDSFPDSATCGASADGAMTRLNETSAIVFDLRENRGGDPEMAEQIAAWLFERPAPWYNPRARSAAQGRTHSPVRSSRLGNKPVYILTSSHTVDGAEQFAYNLKMLKRATVIGERTRGEAHSLMNPHGKPGWVGTGVAPDVEVKASDALQIAEESARARIGKK